MPHSLIVETAASWQVPYSDELWEKLLQVKADVQFKSSQHAESDFLMLGPTLPEAGESRIAQVFVHRHLEPDGGDPHASRLHFNLTVRPAPAGDPPEDVKADSIRIGGRDGLCRHLLHCASGTSPLAGNFRIDLKVEQDHHRCRVIPITLEGTTGLHEPAVDLGRCAMLEQVGYRFENGVNGLEEVAIVYVHVARVFRVTAHARGMLKLSAPTWLPYADEIAELVASGFFVPEGAVR